MDMVFRDDECRIRKANAPANFVTIKNIAATPAFARAGSDAPGSGKHSMRVKRRLAAWDHANLASLITRAG